jgi:hypothetical protein
MQGGYICWGRQELENSQQDAALIECYGGWNEKKCEKGKARSGTGIVFSVKWGRRAT